MSNAQYNYVEGSVPDFPISAGQIMSIYAGPSDFCSYIVTAKALQNLKFTELKNNFLTLNVNKSESYSNNEPKVVNWFKDTFLSNNKKEDKPLFESSEVQFIKWLESIGYIKFMDKNATNNVVRINIDMGMGSKMKL